MYQRAEFKYSTPCTLSRQSTVSFICRIAASTASDKAIERSHRAKEWEDKMSSAETRDEISPSSGAEQEVDVWKHDFVELQHVRIS